MELLLSFGSTIWTYVVPFLVVLSILVFVHEYGHYIVARWNGVRVDVFSIGFGRELFGYTDRAGTRWKFSLLPLGGYVKMHGDADASSSTIDHEAAVDPDSFPAKNVFQRMSIIVAGPLANILFAAVALALLFMIVGRPFTPASVGNVEEDSPAAAAGLMPFDHVIAVDGDEIASFEEFRSIERESAGVELLITVERDGQRLDIPMTPATVIHEDTRLDQTFELGELGVGPPLTPADVANVRPDGAAADAGLEAGDRIVAVDGVTLASFEDLQAIVSQSAEVELLFTVERDGATLDLPITPKRVEITDEQSGESKTIGLIGVERPLPPLHRVGPVTALWDGLKETYRLTALILRAVWQLISGNGSADDVGGPIRIAQITGELTKDGLFPAVMFTVMLSINLGLINLFPIPVLDGGHLVMLFIELVRGKPLNERSQEIAFRFGLALVLSLMVFATLQDLSRFDFGLVEYVKSLVS
ncbi:MAG: RIP metalloprotease RseP [Alphaproteobacteria bacterium]|nr:RIP metalloprotease RseP [Alphaproteobacteria bacterium]